MVEADLLRGKKQSSREPSLLMWIGRLSDNTLLGAVSSHSSGTDIRASILQNPCEAWNWSFWAK